MQKHAHFDLYLPTAGEIAHALGQSVRSRTTLHQWPLSCVERIHTADGQAYICKSISGPLIEPVFYQAIAADLLPGCRVLHLDQRYAIMLLDDLAWTGLAWTRADQMHLTLPQAISLAEQLTSCIRELPASAPLFMDLASASAWEAIVTQMVDTVQALIEADGFGAVTPVIVTRIRRACVAPALVAALDNAPGLIHADLTAQNVFVREGQVKVIDWQFPRRGPRDLDRTLFLMSLGHSPAGVADGGTVALLHLLRIEWFVQCAVRWFPAGRDGYSTQIVENLALAEQALSA
ncbi:MAG: phosphotransferase [Caldilineaceae bacterium]|nr:phosphotransferase [Caldilineaceae bacterium]